MPQPKHVLFVTGGTGGHIYPMLAVLQALRELPGGNEVRCSYVGTSADLEQPSIADLQGVEKHAIHAGKLNRFLTAKQIGETWNALRGMVEARTLLSELRPDAVFAKGSAVSVPVVGAAARLGIPIFSHETDVRSGLANRYAARYAETVFTAYPAENYPDIPRDKLRYVGQPVRPEFFQPHQGPLRVGERETDPNLELVTVIGGSQGGRRLNELVSRKWEAYLQAAQLVHLCGQAQFAELASLAAELPAELQARLYLAPFMQEGVAQAFQASSVAISRAGGTVMELAACRTPTVLVPLSSAAQDHQTANAEVFAEAEAADLFVESGTPEALLEMVEHLLADGERRRRLAGNIARFAKPEAARQIAQTLLNRLG